MIPPNVEAFLAELTQLSRKHRVSIHNNRIWDVVELYDDDFATDDAYAVGDDLCKGVPCLSLHIVKEP